MNAKKKKNAKKTTTTSELYRWPLVIKTHVNKCAHTFVLCACVCVCVLRHSYTCFRSIYCLTVRTNPVSSSSLNCGMLLRLWRLMQRAKHPSILCNFALLQACIAFVFTIYTDICMCVCVLHLAVNVLITERWIYLK